MPMNNPHAYMTHNMGDIQTKNPKNPHIKPKGANVPMVGGFTPKDGVTAEPTGKVSDTERAIGGGTGKGFDVTPGPKGLGEKLRKLIAMKGQSKEPTQTSY